MSGKGQLRPRDNQSHCTSPLKCIHCYIIRTVRSVHLSHYMLACNVLLTLKTTFLKNNKSAMVLLTKRSSVAKLCSLDNVTHLQFHASLHQHLAVVFLMPGTTVMQPFSVRYSGPSTHRCDVQKTTSGKREVGDTRRHLLLGRSINRSAAVLPALLLHPPLMFHASQLTITNTFRHSLLQGSAQKDYCILLVIKVYTGVVDQASQSAAED